MSEIIKVSSNDQFHIPKKIKDKLKSQESLSKLDYVTISLKKYGDRTIIILEPLDR